jgi:hypothetical protein
VVEVAQTVITKVQNFIYTLESLAGLVVESAKEDIASLLNATKTKIEDAVRDSPIGVAVHVAECGGQGIRAAVQDADTTGNCFRFTAT